MPRPVPAVLTIAGSDSGGGAGIQADLKAIAAAGGHGISAITALTAQNTTGVTGVHPVPLAFVREQVRAVATDIGVDAVKTGMLGAAEMVATVADLIGSLPVGTPVVVDPVMVAESGARLLDEDAVEAILARLLPVATVITPNVPEALVLAAALGEAIDPAAPDAAERAARTLHAAMVAGRDAAVPARDGTPGRDAAPDHDTATARDGRAGLGTWVVVTGGHRDELVDTLIGPDGIEAIAGERQPDGAAHGSGCTHASTLATHLAHGASVPAAARAAQAAAARAVRDGLRDLGDGAGPVDVLGVVRRARQIRVADPAAATNLP